MTKAKIHARIRNVAQTFDGDTQKIRGQLVLDLKTLAEMAHDQATKIKERGRPTKEHRKWAKLAADITRVIGWMTKDFDTFKIKEELQHLQEVAARLEAER